MFTYGAMIIVITGFYLGCTGTVKDHRARPFSEEYQVQLNCQGTYVDQIWLNPDVLQKVKK